MKYYEHDLHLLERTKLLEGVLCQSLTFTNENGRQWGEGDVEKPVSALTNKYLNISSLSAITEEKANEIFGIGYYYTPVIYGAKIKIISPYKISTELREAGSGIGRYTASTTLTYGIDGKLSTIKSNETIEDFIEVSPKQSLSIKYSCSASWTDGSTFYTDTFDYQYTIACVENRYPLKPYTITDCICRILELATPIQLGEFPKYKLQGVTYYYVGEKLVRTIERGSQADKYNKIIAPNFAMTQNTLREQLRTVGGYIHAEPRLGYKPSRTVIEENTIIFEEFGSAEETTLPDNGYIYKGMAQSINEYCTNVTTNVTNLVNSINFADGTVINPAPNQFQTLRTDTVNIMMSESNAYIKTQFPIYRVIKVEAILFGAGDKIAIGPANITPYVFEEHEYNTTLSSYEGTYPYSKNYAIYYTQGREGIRGLFFKPDVAEGVSDYAIQNILGAATGTEFGLTLIWAELAFRVTYIPITNAMFSHGKPMLDEGNHEYTAIYSQSDNLVESSFFGENIKGVAARMGNTEVIKTFKLPEKSVIPKAGQKMEDYIISAVKCSYHHTFIKCTVALTKAFNRLSQYVGIKSHKRTSEISEREAYDRNIVIKEYAVIGDKEEEPQNRIATNNFYTLESAIIGGLGNAYAGPITVCTCGGTTSKYYFNEQNKYIEYHNAFALPVVSTALGNAMVFNWRYMDNYSAIENLFQKGDVGTLRQNWIQDLPYSNYYGRLTWYDFTLGENVNTPSQRNFADGAVANVNDSFPFPDSAAGEIFTTSRFYNHYAPILIRKDSREALNFNYVLEFITNRKDLIIGSAVASKCPWVGVDTEHRKVNLYLFNNSANSDFNYKFDKFPSTLSQIPKNANGGDRWVHVISVGPTYDGKIWFKFPKDGDNNLLPFSSWCLAYEPYEKTTTYADEDGNEVQLPEQFGGEITIACNNDVDYYNEKGIDGEEIYISILKSNIKGE